MTDWNELPEDEHPEDVPEPDVCPEPDCCDLWIDLGGEG